MVTYLSAVPCWRGALLECGFGEEYEKMNSRIEKNDLIIYYSQNVYSRMHYDETKLNF